MPTHSHLERIEKQRAAVERQLNAIAQHLGALDVRRRRTRNTYWRLSQQAQRCYTTLRRLSDKHRYIDKRVSL